MADYSGRGDDGAASDLQKYQMKANQVADEVRNFIHSYEIRWRYFVSPLSLRERDICQYL